MIGIIISDLQKTIYVDIAKTECLKSPKVMTQKIMQSVSDYVESVYAEKSLNFRGKKYTPCCELYEDDFKWSIRYSGRDTARKKRYAKVYGYDQILRSVIAIDKIGICQEDEKDWLLSISESDLAKEIISEAYEYYNPREEIL